VCADQEIEQPTSTAEVAAAVKKYYDMSSSTPVKIRVVTRARDFSAADGYRYTQERQSSCMYAACLSKTVVLSSAVRQACLVSMSHDCAD
jgi:hypothetical protein